MNEWLPAVLGCTWGLLAGSTLGWPGARHASRRADLRAHRARAVVVMVLGAWVLGALAAVVNGELAVSAWFAVSDAAIAGAGTAVGAAVQGALAPRLRARRAALGSAVTRATPPRR